MAAVNRDFYDGLWAGVTLTPPQRFNTWPLIEPLAAAAPDRLEVGPGMRPRSPIAGTHFIDLSVPVTNALSALGGLAAPGQITALPFPDARFDLVCAFDIVEHTEDDRKAFAELSRVLRPGGVFIFSVPLFKSSWTYFDEAVGHYRRYEPDALMALLKENGFTLEKSAVFGMQPKSQTLLKLGIWWIRNRYEQAMRWYNRLFMPLALRFQKKLRLEPGLINLDKVDEIILVCRKNKD
jgi:SAM-dependent methyltransferase